MAASKIPGWQSELILGQVDDGTSCRFAAQSPGVIGQNFDTLHGRLRRNAPTGERLRCVKETYLLAVLIAPMEIRTELRDDISQVIDGLLPSILQMLKVVSISTGVGAAAGALVGAAAGGVGAAPGAALGGVAGFDISIAVLTWMGLGFLIGSIATNLNEFGELIGDAGKMAWEAAEYVDPFQNQQINLAARKLARAAALLVVLILQAIVALLLKKQMELQVKKLAKVPSLTKGNDLVLTNAQAASEVAVDLRKSSLGQDFADWIEKNSQTLLDDPKLRQNSQIGTENIEFDARSSSRADESTGERRSPTRSKPPQKEQPVGIQSNSKEYWFDDKIEGQMLERGWDLQKVNDLLANPTRIADTDDTRYNINGIRNSYPSTAYLDEHGNYVVIRNSDGNIVQVSHLLKDWKIPTNFRYRP